DARPTSAPSADGACARPPAAASPGTVKRGAEPPERGRIKKVPRDRIPSRRHIPTGPDAAGARCTQSPPRTTKAAPAAEPLFLVRRKRFAFSPGLGPRLDGSLVRFGESVVSPTRTGGQPS